ncbi:MAG: GNAT family N-acetyltransferase [Planctomycetes bacterium]|nr:GNAT family N-acetyltransferase [Planctomycetota bacterium]
MIRPFRPTDRDELIKVTVRAFDGVSIDQNIENLYGVVHGVRWQERKGRHVENDIAVNPAGIFVFEDQGRIAGFISCRFDRQTLIGSVPNLAVHPGHQGKGIGKRLIAAGLAYLRSLGMKFVRIETLEQNRRCVALYPRLGFREVARQIHYILPLDERQ